MLRQWEVWRVEQSVFSLTMTNPSAETITEPAVAPPTGKGSKGIGTFFHILAIVFSVPAIAWGAFMVWSTASPPPCGDFSGFTPLGAVECWVVDLPIGFIALAIGFL